ncbi:hypothetical protein [Bifidobacterium sp. SO4]|uniref:hypothetical protein n=1 Tax=Bifidobacterium sp. SO4 TaxID=2809030 RepID=UPI001BDD43A7|nr:hypothetical protein [Bifidobacterium sp. SO4]MBT1171225.1 hypothetical protein [Bifidobacterium sp. SO4]
MVEHTSGAEKRSFDFPASAIPAEVINMEDPEYIARRLAMPVAAGQLWMAKTKGEAQYVLITAVDGEDPRTITVIPLSNNTAERTDGSLIVDRTPLGMPMVAWPALATSIPVRVLFKPLDEFNPQTTEALAADHADEKLGINRATAPDDPMESAEQEIHEIEHSLESWHKLCADLPKLHADRTAAEHSGDELAAYADALKNVLHLTPGQRIAVSRGKALTDEQQSRMAAAGFPESPYNRPQVDDDYLVEVEQPRWRAAANALAASGVTGDPRERLAYKAQFELAARVNGHGVEALRGALHKAAATVLADPRD